jgi:hypothetical protein
MRTIHVLPIVYILAVPGIAVAQTSSSPNSQSTPHATPQPNAQASSSSNERLLSAQKLKQDLEKAGFSDVNVVAESFLVQGKSKDGDPFVMTIGPHGASMLEVNSAKSASTGSTAPQSAQKK